MDNKHAPDHKHMNGHEIADLVRGILDLLSRNIPCPGDALKVLILSVCEVGDICGLQDTQILEEVARCLKAKSQAMAQLEMLRQLLGAKKAKEDGNHAQA